jgi:hypothetical protein
MENENNTEGVIRNGRRKTDTVTTEEILPSTISGGVRGVFKWFFSFGLVAALIAVGRASHTLDTAIADNDKQDKRIEQLFLQNQKLILALHEQNIQQKESDKRFEEKFDKTIDTLEDVKDGVNRNSKDIIILQQKVSMRDKTTVYLAMR